MNTSQYQKVAEVRNWIRNLPVNHIPGNTLHDIIQVASELVANSLKQPRVSASVEVHLGNTNTALKVFDNNPGTLANPVKKPDYHGWGLALAQELSHRLEMEETPQGKCLTAYFVTPPLKRKMAPSIHNLKL